MNAPLHREMAGTPAWDAAAALDQITRQWDGDIVRRLTEYIAVPAKSLAFDPDWAAHGYMDQAVELLARRLDGLHDAHHAAMECLGQMLADSQRNGHPPDGDSYVAAVQRRATRD